MGCPYAYNFWFSAKIEELGAEEFHLKTNKKNLWNTVPLCQSYFKLRETHTPQSIFSDFLSEK